MDSARGRGGRPWSECWVAWQAVTHGDFHRRSDAVTQRRSDAEFNASNKYGPSFAWHFCLFPNNLIEGVTVLLSGISSHVALLTSKRVDASASSNV